MILTLLRRGQRPAKDAPYSPDGIFPAAEQHLRHALSKLGLGNEEKFSGLIDRLVRMWATVTDHLLRHAHLGMTADHLLEWCLRQGNEHGWVDPECGKPGLIMKVIQTHMGKLAKDHARVLKQCQFGQRPEFSLPGDPAFLVDGINAIMGGDPDRDTVLGPFNDPWPPGKRTQLIKEAVDRKHAEELEMNRTGLAADGTPALVVRIRRELNNLLKCRDERDEQGNENPERVMIPLYLAPLKILVDELLAIPQCAAERNEPPPVDDEWMKRINTEIRDVLADLSRLGLLPESETDQAGTQPDRHPESVSEERVADSMGGTAEEYAAAIASLDGVPQENPTNAKPKEPSDKGVVGQGTTPTRPLSRWGEHYDEDYDEDYEEELNQCSAG